MVRSTGAGQALELYRETRARQPLAFSESEVNNLGYASLQAGRTEEAIAVFRINTDAHPESSNAWDSLGEAYMEHGDNEKAALYYQKSLDLNPENTNAVERLKKLQR